MTTQEIEKQREIGKLLLLVEIIHQENDRVANGGISFFSREKLANWSSMKEEEVEKLIDVCESLDTANLPTDAASNKRKDYPAGSNAYAFILHTYMGYGDFVLRNLKSENLSKVCEVMTEVNYQSYIDRFKEYPVDETFSESKTFEKLIKYYANFMVNRIDGAIEMGYDWDVIQKMLRRELPYERFVYLKNEFSAC